MPAIPPSTRVTDATSWNVSPCSVTGTDGAEASAAIPTAAWWIALSACHGRAECPERPENVHVALMLPRQPACSSPSVGSITTTNSASSLWRSSSGVSALSVDGSSSRGKNSAAYGARASTSSIITASAPFMSEAPSPNTRPSADPAGDVALRRHRVQMPREQHRRAHLGGVGEHARVAEILDHGAALAQHGSHVRGELRLVAGLGRDVDQLERARGETLRQLGFARRGGHRHEGGL